MFFNELTANDMNWFAGEAPARTFECTAKTRYRQVDIPVVVEVITDDHQEIKVQFKSPERAPTPGQYVVLYQGDVCLGGGVIHHVGKSLFEIQKQK